MLRLVFLLLLSVFSFPLYGSVLYADEPAADAPIDDDAANDGTSEVLVNAAEALREIVISDALDRSSDCHHQAIKILKQRKYRDERFNQRIREAFGGNKGDEGRQKELEYALEMIPYSTLTGTECVNLILPLFAEYANEFAEETQRHAGAISIGDFKQDGLPTAALVAMLRRFPSELTRVLPEYLRKGDATPIMCSLAELTVKENLEVLPLIVDAAKSDDRATKLTGLHALNHLLSGFSDRRALVQSQGAIDSKYFSYAERLIGRYDLNHDGSLTQDEWKTMLMSPSEADTDGDDKVTASEYAVWMESQRK
ncbi:EF-hand domain-containing protein [Stieleria varia]|uniref:EF hand n=1 Tax=Stieleria varia TaxID=2528005 RepID=A0A5C5ZZ36_9BACT|nr:hypothetical protein [Stieleria varia]TWT92341.1 EF hand [Stieleria varia]